MKKLKVYLDNCCFNRPYDDQTQVVIAVETKAKLFVQRLITDDKIDLVWSFISAYENNHNPYPDRREAIGRWQELAVQPINKTDEIIILAREIMQSGIKHKDALHLASAISVKCDYFITVDDRLLKHKTDDISILNPMQFIKEWSERND